MQQLVKSGTRQLETAWVFSCYSKVETYASGLGFRGLGFRGFGFRGLGFRGLGFRGLGFRV